MTFFLQSLGGNKDANILLKENTGLGVFRDVNTVNNNVSLLFSYTVLFR